MARTYLRSEIRAAAEAEADMPASSTSTLCTLVQVNLWIDQEKARLWEMLIDAGLGYYAEATPDQWTTNGSTGVHALTATFGRLIAVEFQESTSRWCDVPRAHPAEVADYGTTGTYAEAYRFDGANVVLLPTPGAGLVYRVRYFAAPAVMSGDSDTVDGVSGFEEYIILAVAVKMKNKQESNASALWARRQEILDRIEKARFDRLQYRPAGRIRDTDSDRRMTRALAECKWTS